MESGPSALFYVTVNVEEPGSLVPRVARAHFCQQSLPALLTPEENAPPGPSLSLGPFTSCGQPWASMRTELCLVKFQGGHEETRGSGVKGLGAPRPWEPALVLLVKEQRVPG